MVLRALKLYTSKPQTTTLMSRSMETNQTYHRYWCFNSRTSRYSNSIKKRGFVSIFKYTENKFLPSTFCIIFLSLGLSNTILFLFLYSQYYDGGHCVWCAPCPKDWKDREMLYNSDCLEAFYACPNLCRRRLKEWSPDELADKKICEDLEYRYTTEPASTTTETVTTSPFTTAQQITTSQDHITLNNGNYRTAASIVPPFFHVKFVLKWGVALCTGARSDTKIPKPIYLTIPLKVHNLFMCVCNNKDVKQQSQ